MSRYSITTQLLQLICCAKTDQKSKKAVGVKVRRKFPEETAEFDEGTPKNLKKSKFRGLSRHSPNVPDWLNPRNSDFDIKA